MGNEQVDSNGDTTTSQIEANSEETSGVTGPHSKLGITCIFNAWLARGDVIRDRATAARALEGSPRAASPRRQPSE